jgi:hypothetical protein
MPRWGRVNTNGKVPKTIAATSRSLKGYSPDQKQQMDSNLPICPIDIKTAKDYFINLGMAK